MVENLLLEIIYLFIYLHRVCRCSDITWSPHPCPSLGINFPMCILFCFVSIVVLPVHLRFSLHFTFIYQFISPPFGRGSFPPGVFRLHPVKNFYCPSLPLFPSQMLCMTPLEIVVIKQKMKKNNPTSCVTTIY